MPKVHDSPGLGAGPYRNPPPPPPPGAPPAGTPAAPPTEVKPSWGWRVGKWLLVLGVGAAGGWYITRKLEQWFPKEEEGSDGASALPASPFGMPMGLGPTVMPMPIPFPMPMQMPYPQPPPPTLELQRNYKSTSDDDIDDEEEERPKRSRRREPSAFDPNDPEHVYAQTYNRRAVKRARKAAMEDADFEELFSEFEDLDIS